LLAGGSAFELRARVKTVKNDERRRPELLQQILAPKNQELVTEEEALNPLIDQAARNASRVRKASALVPAGHATRGTRAAGGSGSLFVVLRCPSISPPESRINFWVETGKQLRPEEG
jgi:hypothetical protein